MSLNTCQAVLVTEDGVEHRCGQTLAFDSVSGLPLCYFHDGYATGTKTPAPSRYPEDRTAFMYVRGTSLIFPLHAGGEPEAKPEEFVTESEVIAA